VIFFTVCGGAFGIESLVGKLGAGWGIALIVLTPLMWSIPISLMVSELASAIPEEGGYYIWVKRALGNFWGFQEGWLTCVYTAVNMAIFPVLFVNYLAFFVPALQPDTAGGFSTGTFAARWAVTAGVIFLALALNWRGARAVGLNSTVNLLVILAPFALLTYFALTSEIGGIGKSIDAVRDGFSNEIGMGLIAVGLATVMWNYSGYDNVSTFAAEVNDASKNYPRALFTAVALSVAVYFLPVFALVGVTVDQTVWNETAGFPALAEMLGGTWLGFLLGAAGLISAWSLFNSQVLYASRLPFAMANDGWFPKFFAKTDESTGVPTNALIVCCAISALLAALSFGNLVVINILFYSAELLLEFIALIVLRYREPDLPRPFRVPGGWPVLVLITLAPMSFAATVIAATVTDPETDLRQTALVVGGLGLGVIFYFLRRKNIETAEVQ
jgi:amino acid transporter